VTAADRAFPRPTVGLGALAFIWLGMLAWARPLMLPDEGRYVGVAWEMMRSGDWLTPTLNGLPYFHKPPLFYWITAASMTIFGSGDWAARAAPLLGAWTGAMAVFFFLRRWWGERSARLALIALLTQPLFYIGGQFANLDMLVAGCITVTTVLAAHAALAFERGLPHRHWVAAAYAAAALGVLAKGLIGLVLPALVIGAWLLVGHRWRTLRVLMWLPGAVLFLMIAAPWFVAMQWRFEGFLDYFFIVQHFKRFAAGGFNNVQPFWFYPAVLVLFTLPWLPWLRSHFARGRLADPERGDLRLLMILWTAVVVLFFSLPESKLLGYVLPAVPPLAVLLADGFETRASVTVRAWKGWWISAGIATSLSIVAILVLAVRTPHSTKQVAAALQAQRAAPEPVYMLDNYYFDLPLYAHLKSPVGLVLDWDDPEIRRRDTWRKELADAGAFAAPLARTALLTRDRFAPLLCVSPVNWVVGPAAATKDYPFLAGARVVATAGDATLWQVVRPRQGTPAGLACTGTPSAG
jgi:4-amino-4-deoxy-L-arabinose transferase-like glycosyltransferase